MRGNTIAPRGLKSDFLRRHKKLREDFSMMIDERVFSLKRKLEKKRGCKLNPPLYEETVQSLESQFHFVLPEEYRRFLILAGNGGRIPPFTEDCNEFLPLPTDPGQLEKLQLPFAFQDSCVWEDGSKDWIDAFRGNGTILLAEDETDNQITWLLIVTGEHSGEIWLRGEAGIWRVKGLSFLDWMELALSKKLSRTAAKSVRQYQKKKEASQPDRFTQVHQKTKEMAQYGFRWNPPISLDEVRAFEQKHGITLPEEYVRFITEISDGGSDETLQIHSLHDFEHLDGLSDPFPFQSQEDWDRIPFKKYSSPIGRTFWEDWSLYFPNIKMPEQIDKIWHKKEYSVLRGSLPIVTEKNNPPPRRAEYIQHVLILNGEFKGNVCWLINHKILTTRPEDFFSCILYM